MITTNESGHANNVANGETLIAVTNSLGALYNPPKTSIKTAGLTTSVTTCRTSLTAVNNCIPTYKNAVLARRMGFEKLDPLIRRSYDALKASDSSIETDEIVQTIVRKFLGQRAAPKKSDEEKQKAAAEGIEVNEISVSQRGYDNRLENFDKYLRMLTTIPQYLPNEADLKLTALTTLYNDLKAKNAAVMTASIALDAARQVRNDALYKDNTGLVDLAYDVKKYIRSAFGTNSLAFKQVSKLKFTKPSNL